MEMMSGESAAAAGYDVLDSQPANLQGVKVCAS
jgi:hypothetical protein